MELVPVEVITTAVQAVQTQVAAEAAHMAKLVMAGLALLLSNINKRKIWQR
jgi:hypothetical protein